MPHNTKEKVKIYRLKNRDKINKQKRESYQRNKKHALKYGKQYFKVNKDKILCKGKLLNVRLNIKTHLSVKMGITKKQLTSIRLGKYYLDNIEKIKSKNNIRYHGDKHNKILEKTKERNKKAYAKDPLPFNLKNKKWADKNKDKVARKGKRWKQNNPDRVLVQDIRRLTTQGKELNLTHVEYRYALMSWARTIKKLLGKKCLICGSTDGLNIHHILYKALYPKLSLNINNGVPLCKEHHLEIHRLNPMVRK